MRDFAVLFAELDSSTKTNAKVETLVQYFRKTHLESDKLWTIAFLSGRRPKRLISTSEIREWARQLVGLPPWMVDESYRVTGDLAETISLLLPEGQQATNALSLTDWMVFLRSLGSISDAERRERIIQAWAQMSRTELFVLNKLITGNFRVGVSRGIVVKALAQYLQREPALVEQAIMGSWTPESATFSELFSGERHHHLQPFPFFLASQLEDDLAALGSPSEWLAEWKWDGIRAQLVLRQGDIAIWSRGEEILTDRFPDLHPLIYGLPEGTVVDGELLIAKEGRVQPFQILQTRIGRKNLTPKVLEDAPAIFLAYDLLELDGKDIREWPLETRRAHLSNLVRSVPLLQLSPAIPYSSWGELYDLRTLSRQQSAEGLMLKRKGSSYRSGRKRGDWWKWKVDPFTVDAVLVAGQRGHGRRANMYSDYTFAVWQGDSLVTFAKAYSGLTDAEIQDVDRFIERNTVDRFGPVRTVPPKLVFELGFDGIQESRRHKSGVAVRFPRILRWRKDKPASEADTLASLHALLRVAKGEI
jgi:DNA ligase 1